jgi:hypothetical protein
MNWRLWRKGKSYAGAHIVPIDPEEIPAGLREYVARRIEQDSGKPYLDGVDKPETHPVLLAVYAGLLLYHESNLGTYHDTVGRLTSDERREISKFRNGLLASMGSGFDAV